MDTFLNLFGKLAFLRCHGFGVQCLLQGYLFRRARNQTTNPVSIPAWYCCTFLPYAHTHVCW